MERQNDTDKLLSRLEEENGGTIRFRTYCTLHGLSDGTIVGLGGLLYIVDDRLIFEDFEKESNSIVSLFSTRKQTYRKYKISNDISRITGIRFVSAGALKRSLKRGMPTDRLSALPPLWRKLLQPVIEISFKDEPSWYAETLNDRELITQLEVSNESI